MDRGVSASSAPEARPAGAGFVPLTGGARPSLAFFALGLAFLAFGGMWAAVQGVRGWPVFLHPGAAALAHAWLPGFLLSICAGATYQLMPVVLGCALAGPRALPWTHFALHAPGSLLLVAGLAAGSYGLAAAGGAFVALGALALLAATLATFATSNRRDVVAWSFVAASGWLAAAVFAGILIALNRRAPFLPLGVIGLLGAHAHLGLAGYFLSLLQGVSFQLVPMFTLGQAQRMRTAAAGLILSQSGLPILATGLAADIAYPAWAGALLVMAGIGCSLWAGAATLGTRRRRALEPGLSAFVAGACLLAAGAVAGLAIAAGVLPGTGRPGGLAGYGIVVVAGGLSLCVLGMLCKILPFLVWMRAYAPHAGRRPVPAATGLSLKPLERLWLAAHLSGVGLIAAGVSSGIEPLSAAGGWLLATGVLVHAANSVRVLMHLVRPFPQAAPVHSVSNNP